MGAMFRKLPREEKYPLPPRQITERSAKAAGVDRHLDEGQRDRLTWLSHFSYGAGMGALYGLGTEARSRDRAWRSDLAKGMAFGTLVWAGSYSGYLPQLKLTPPVRHQPWRRTVLMILAHWVWGASLGALYRLTWSSPRIPRACPGNTQMKG